MSSFSIVVPVYNESENLSNLIEEIFLILGNNYKFELIIVDDASNDDTIFSINNIQKKYNFKLLKHKKNMGQSFALKTGILNSKYDHLITLDGDGQNNPIDIPKIIDLYFNNENYKLIGGIRKKRKDSILKIISSRIANFIRMKILKDNCIDTGCSLKIFDKKIFLKFPFFNGIHRFLPSLFSGFGFQTFFIEVDHRSRLFGKSKYGTFGRMIRGVVDIVRVLIIIKKYKQK